MASVGAIVIDIRADMAHLVKTTEKANRYVQKQSKSFNKTMKGMASGVLALGAAYVSVQTVMKAFDIAADFTKTAAQFEKFETILTTIEGSSEAAEKSMKWIEDFTKETPFQLEAVTESFVKLRAYGLEPTEGLLETLGDTSSAMGKSIIQGVEAIADAVTGENERLKEFGIKASKAGDTIRYNWVNASGEARTKLIENNQEIIQSTLEAIFNSKYEGAMEAQSRTWNGMISNMQDRWVLFQKNIMEGGLFEYMKAVVVVVGEWFGKAFDTAGDKAEQFAMSAIEGIKWLIGGLGAAYDSLETFGDYFAVVSDLAVLGFWGIQGASSRAALWLVEAFEGAFNFVIDGVNAIIETIETVSMGTISFGKVEHVSWSGDELDRAQYVDAKVQDAKAELAISYADLMDADNGQTFTDKLIADIDAQYEKMKNAVVDTKEKTDFGDIPDPEAAKKAKTAKEDSKALEKIEKSARDIQTALVKASGSDYEKFLDNLNNDMLDLYNKGASADELEMIFEAETKKYEDALDTQTKELVSAISSSGGVGSDVYSVSGNSTTIVGDSGYQKVGSGFIEGSLEEKLQQLNTYLDSGAGKRVVMDFDPVSMAASPTTRKRTSSTRLLAQAEKWKIEKEIAGIKRAEEAAQRAAAAEAERLRVIQEYMDATISLTSALDGMESSMMGLLDGLNEDWFSQAREALFGGTDNGMTYAEALGNANEAWMNFQQNNNQDLLDIYDDRMSELVGTLDDFNDTTKFQTKAEQEFAKYLALGQIEGFQDAQQDVQEEIDLQLEVLTAMKEILADGQVTQEEALKIADLSKEALTNGTLKTNDKQAINWLTLVNSATKDGTLSVDELQGLTNTTNAYVSGINSKANTTNSVLNSQTPVLRNTELNTGMIGSYDVVNNHELVKIPMLGGTYKEEYVVTSQTFTPYKNGGFTGNYGVNEIAGVTHGQEYILDADTTKGLGLNNSSSTGVFGEIANNLKVQNKMLQEQNALLKEQLNVSSDTRDNTDRLVLAS